MFQGIFKGVSRKFQGRLKGFCVSFKSVSRVFYESFMEEEVSRVFHDFQWCLESVSRKFQENFQAVSKKCHVGTHRSFPSRRGACFYMFIFFSCISDI